MRARPASASIRPMVGWEQRIVTGNAEADRQTVEQHRQAAAAQGLSFYAQPLQGGGFQVRAYVPAHGGQGAPAHQAVGYPGAGYPQAASYPQVPNGGMTFQSVSNSHGTSVGGGPISPTQVSAAPAYTADRLSYIRKVYGLLLASVVVACIGGVVALNLGSVSVQASRGHNVSVPLLVGLMLSSRIVWYGMFGLLFVATLGASAVSRVRGLNVVALFGVSALMGLEVSPMIFIAQYSASSGHTLSAAPVAHSFLIVGAAFVGASAYSFISRKDFSFLGAALSMGFWVVFAASILAIFVRSEIFFLAIASVGALVAAGMLLMQTSRIFRGPMDDAVGDALGLLVQLRNLFVFVLRILMSRR